MGDLRNKFMKQARDEAHRQFMARRYPPKPEPPPVRCPCGNTYYDAPLAQYQLDRRKPQAICCPACAPADVRDLMGWA